MLTFLVYLIWLNQSSSRPYDANSAWINRLFWTTLFLWPIGGAVLSERYLEDRRHRNIVTVIPMILAVLIYIFAGFAIYLVTGFVIGLVVIGIALTAFGNQLMLADTNIEETP